jgi:glycosyltransferase involved in cell wall biosynthesis
MESNAAGHPTSLDSDVLARIDEIGGADILVGVPSFRAAKTIAHVVAVASEGMARYFPGLRHVLVNADGGSEDDTRQVVLDTPVPESVAKIVTPYRGLPGKGSAFKTIFEIADRLEAKVCIVVDSDLRSITPEWIQLLGEPIWRHNFGFVAPHYLRYKYDGTITNGLAYPLTRALYGHIVRQPIGGDFGVTWALAKIFSHQDIWDSEDIARFGIDIWITTTAINEGFRICQAEMGVKLHDPKDPASDLGPMFRQVVGTMFHLMSRYETRWKAARGSQPTDLFGEPRDEEPETEPVAVDLQGLITNFQKACGGDDRRLELILAPDNYAQIKEMCRLPLDLFSFPFDLWVRVVYDFAVAYQFSGMAPSEIVEQLYPIYQGRTASFVLETVNLPDVRAEASVEKLAVKFEQQKPYLIQRWNEAMRLERGRG